MSPEFQSDHAAILEIPYHKFIPSEFDPALPDFPLLLEVVVCSWHMRRNQRDLEGFREPFCESIESVIRTVTTPDYHHKLKIGVSISDRLTRETIVRYRGSRYARGDGSGQ